MGCALVEHRMMTNLRQKLLSKTSDAAQEDAIAHRARSADDAQRPMGCGMSTAAEEASSALQSTHRNVILNEVSPFFIPVERAR